MATCQNIVFPESCPPDSVSNDGRPVSLQKTSNRIITGARFPITSRNHDGSSVLNAMMNVTRYRASGRTHNRGSETMSVVMWKVTASIQLDGTNANTTHFNIRRRDGGGS